jgi:hypothetical protein
MVVLWGVTAGIGGCRSEQPAASPSPATQGAEGPVLAPPQQQSAPAAPKADGVSFPTEGDPTAKAQAAQPAKARMENALTAQPTEGDPEGKLRPSNAALPAVAETVEAAKIKANLASLSEADRAAVEKQKICPVSGEALGSMGTPKKIRVAGKDVFICCPSCEEPLTSEPAKYLPRIGLSESP